MSKRTKNSRLDLFAKILEISFEKIPKLGRKASGFPRITFFAATQTEGIFMRLSCTHFGWKEIPQNFKAKIS